MNTVKKMLASISSPLSYVVPMALGGMIALGLISFFVFGVDNPNPEWPANWQVKPLVLTPLSGLFAGAFFHFLKPLRELDGWKKIFAYLFSIFAFLVILWLGVVLGLNGTMWN